MKSQKHLIVLVSLFVASLVTANLIGSKLILIGGVTMSVGIFVFPITFLVTDILSEIYGPKVATTVVVCGLAIQLYVLFFVWLGGVIPSAPRRDLTEAYAQMYSLTPRMVIASITAYTCSQLMDVRLFHFFKKLTGGKYLWTRNNFSTMFSQAFDSAIFLGIFLYGVLPFSELVKTFFTLYFLKVGMAAIDTPLVYLGVRLLRGPTSSSAHQVVPQPVKTQG
jgi:hypothetical protein